ncbi:MAG: peptidoglycan DD-metalloendopeptidase family protein [Bacteroidales bacterium]
MGKTQQILIVVFLFQFIPFLLYPQSKEELRERVSRKQKEIQNASRILEETKETRTSSVNELYVIQKRIDLRNELIESLNHQIDDIDENIDTVSGDIDEARKELEKLKENYAQIIYYAYKNSKSIDHLMFILSAKTFNQAYKRYKYLHQYAQFRRNQAKRIKSKAKELDNELTELKNLRSEKENILETKLRETETLKREKTSLSQKISSLKNKEAEIRKEIEENEQIVARLENEIEKIIEEERKRTATWKNLSEDHKEITNAFEEGKGNLPWPITDGVVSRKFGENSHPVLKGVKLDNNGIDISTTKNSQAKSIFPGEVRKVVSIPGANLTVILRHGSYLTVYSNLVDVNVDVGDKIDQGEIIGKVFNNEEKNENILHLEIYKENNKLNPEAWLR